MISGDNNEAKKQQVKWVSKEQYDDLLTRYKNLEDQYSNLKEEKNEAPGSFDQRDEMLDRKRDSKQMSEAIDVFAKDGLANQVEKSALAPSATKVQMENYSSDSISKDLEHYQKAMAYKFNQNTSEALKILQHLERSKFSQIRVRAKHQLGLIYMEKKQYDLALQVFEWILTNDAFSGRVIDSLKESIKACDNLGLSDKKLKYRSILKDFFEIEG